MAKAASSRVEMLYRSISELIILVRGLLFPYYLSIAPLLYFVLWGFLHLADYILHTFKPKTETENK